MDRHWNLVKIFESVNNTKIPLKSILREENSLSWMDNPQDMIPKGEIESLEREMEGNNLSDRDFAYLTPWLWTNSEIRTKTEEHDKLEKKKIPRLQKSSLDIFKEIIFNNIKIKNNNIEGFDKATKELSIIFHIDDTLSKIELGKLVKNNLKFNILNEVADTSLIKEADSNEIIRSLYGLVKSNAGLFKSDKQRNFILSKTLPHGTDDKGNKEWYTQEGGSMYGNRYYTDFFLDELGVKRIEKRTDKKGSKVFFERPADQAQIDAHKNSYQEKKKYWDDYKNFREKAYADHAQMINPLKEKLAELEKKNNELIYPLVDSLKKNNNNPEHPEVKEILGQLNQLKIEMEQLRNEISDKGDMNDNIITSNFEKIRNKT